jgi:hypothetical protein
VKKTATCTKSGLHQTLRKRPNHRKEEEEHHLVDPVELFARLSLHESLISEVYAQLMRGGPEQEREAFIAGFIDRLRFRMESQAQDGELSFQLQGQTILCAERFFAKVREKVGEKVDEEVDE